MAEEKPDLSKYPRSDVIDTLLESSRYGEDDDIEMVQTIIDYDTSFVNEQDGQGRTALHMACANGHSEILKVLLTAKPDADKVTTEGSTALHFAASNGNESCIAQLLAAGFSITAKNKFGRKPIDECWGKGNSKIEDLFLMKDPEVEAALPKSEKPEAGDLSGMDPPPKESAGDKPKPKPKAAATPAPAPAPPTEQLSMMTME
eukprot:TRINITY_DN891_c4_g1_i1.p1 TRINITY_DN891_c4_g1~~TRINITY_DN891_c4_g1_i1.p1  ORF type:complete len:203 (+),score=53.10 TRINITY_DN891_c4_g1_i1:43-651(+)